MDEWHHQRNGHKFWQTSGDREGQRGLAFGSPWYLIELNTTWVAE